MQSAFENASTRVGTEFHLDGQGGKRGEGWGWGGGKPLSARKCVATTCGVEVECFITPGTTLAAQDIVMLIPGGDRMEG